MARPPPRFSPGSVASHLALCFGLWLIVGAIAHTDLPSSAEDYTSFGEVLLLTFIPMLFFAFLMTMSIEYDLHPSPPVSSSAVFIASVVCASVTMAFCVVTYASRNAFQHCFLVMSSIGVGGILETVTGGLTGYLERMERVVDVRGRDERGDKLSS